MKLLIPCLIVLCALAGCAGTTSAYKEAQTPAEYAYVLSEHYAALLSEAAKIAENPATPPRTLALLQEADRLTKPAVLSLRGLAATFESTGTAADAVALQKAIDTAVLRIAAFVRALKTARGLPTASVEQPFARLEVYAS